MYGKMEERGFIKTMEWDKEMIRDVTHKSFYQIIPFL